MQQKTHFSQVHITFSRIEHTMESYLAIMKSCHWQQHDGLWDMLSEVSQREKDKYHNFTYMCNIKNKQNPNKWTNQTKWKETFRHRAESSVAGKGLGRGEMSEKGLTVCDEWKLNFWWGGALKCV